MYCASRSPCEESHFWWFFQLKSLHINWTTVAWDRTSKHVKIENLIMSYSEETKQTVRHLWLLWWGADEPHMYIFSLARIGDPVVHTTVQYKPRFGLLVWLVWISYLTALAWQCVQFHPSVLCKKSTDACPKLDKIRSIHHCDLALYSWGPRFPGLATTYRYCAPGKAGDIKMPWLCNRKTDQQKLDHKEIEPPWKPAAFKLVLCIWPCFQEALMSGCQQTIQSRQRKVRLEPATQCEETPLRSACPWGVQRGSDRLVLLLPRANPRPTQLGWCHPRRTCPRHRFGGRGRTSVGSAPAQTRMSYLFLLPLHNTGSF